jgi:hypothetical protein
LYVLIRRRADLFHKRIDAVAERAGEPGESRCSSLREGSGSASLSTASQTLHCGESELAKDGLHGPANGFVVRMEHSGTFAPSVNPEFTTLNRRQLASEPDNYVSSASARRLALCGQNVAVNAIQSSGRGWVAIRSERFLWELAELRWTQSGTKAKVLTKACYQRSPLFWIDTIRLTGRDKALMNVYSHNSHFDRYGGKRAYPYRFRQMVGCFRRLLRAAQGTLFPVAL